mmetsp:Transcript_5421/g.16778  ORF Transcript_5421/g.16778 Transcript_5421/m.16778 type:complete len:386 (-) Transcript_5421:662-1819(-)
MASDMAPETELPTAEDEATPAGRSDDAAETPQPKGGKKKRQWQKVNTADYYQPAPYVAQKGTGKGGGKGGKGGKGGPEGEGGCSKGKGKGKDVYSEVEPPKPPDDTAKPPAGAEGLGQAGLEGDPSQPKLGLGAKSKKQGGKGREGKGKGAGKALSGAPRKGAKGAPRGAPLPGELPEPSAEAPEGPRPPGPQRPPAPAKGGPSQGGVTGVPMAMAPYSYGTAVPYPYGAVPYPYGGAMPAMYLPYYVMPSPTPLNTGSTPYMPGGPPPQSQTVAGGSDRQSLKSQVQSQIEYYFGRENMIKDVYLRSSLMNEEGWVQIAPLANFRRIQSMTTDMSIIMDAIASSQKLEMDPQGQLVRLKTNWQEWVLSPKSGSQPAATPTNATT